MCNCIWPPVIGLWDRCDLGPSTVSFNVDLILAHFDSEESLFAPEVAPTVPDDPVGDTELLVEPPASDRHQVVCFPRGSGNVQYSPFVGVDWLCVYRGSYWPEVIHLVLNWNYVVHCPKRGNCCIRIYYSNCYYIWSFRSIYRPIKRRCHTVCKCSERCIPSLQPNLHNTLYLNTIPSVLSLEHASYYKQVSKGTLPF